MSEILENVNQQHMELAGLANNMLPFRFTCSPVRMYMFGTHLSQAPVPLGCTKDRFWTPAHFEYAKYTFKVKAKHDYFVYGEVSKYHTNVTRNSYRMNPHTTYVVRNRETGEFDIIEKPRYVSHHNNFCFEYVENEEIKRNRLKKDGLLHKGDVISQSPSIGPDGRWRPGFLAKSVSTSSPYSAEDGYEVSDVFCDAMTTLGYGRIAFTVPDDHYLLHVVGKGADARPLPGPGEYIRKDGLLAAMRRHDDILDGVMMSPSSMEEIDFFFDEKIYIESYCREAMVVDIEVHRNENNVTAMQPYCPDGTGEPTDAISRHAEALRDYYGRILDQYEKILKDCKRDGRTPTFSPEFTHLIWLAEGIAGRFPGQPGKVDTVPYIGRNEELSGTHIIITYVYKVRAGIGTKVTGTSGNKGVICKINKQHEMPTDRFGNIADVVMSNIAPMNRMSASVPFEQYYHYKADETEREIKRIISELGRTDAGYQAAYERALSYYKIIVRMFHDAIVSRPRDRQFIRDHVDDILASGLDMEFDSLNQNIGIDAIREMETAYPSKYENAVRYAGFTGTEEEWNATPQGQLRLGPVTFMNEQGEMETSRSDIMVGSSYFLMLEHVGKSYSASMMPEAQVHGVPAKASKADRHSQPFHLASGRMYGEADVRSEIGQTNPRQVADQIDRVNNPHVQEEIMERLIASETPTNLDSIVDRDKHPIGEGLHLAFLRNHLYCAGAEMAYYDVDNLGTPPKTVQVELDEDAEEDEDDIDEDDDLDEGDDDYEREDEV